MKFVGIVPALPVKDVKETQDYYEKVFGFKPHWIWENRFGSVYGGQAFEIHLDKSEVPFSRHTCYINVDDADAYCEKMKSSGAMIIEEIRSTPWGMREYVVEENNGHRFRIGHGEKAVKEIGEFKIRE
jgi:uncharacterized glyoxalase superfamily protein PhnB